VLARLTTQRAELKSGSRVQAQLASRARWSNKGERDRRASASASQRRRRAALGVREKANAEVRGALRSADRRAREDYPASEQGMADMQKRHRRAAPNAHREPAAQARLEGRSGFDRRSGSFRDRGWAGQRARNRSAWRVGGACRGEAAALGPRSGSCSRCGARTMQHRAALSAIQWAAGGPRKI